RLARAGRPLDEEIAVVERRGPGALLGRVERLDRPGERFGQPRAGPGDDVLERAVAPVTSQPGTGESRQRSLLLRRAVRPRRDQRGRQRNRRQARAASQGDASGLIVDVLDDAGVVARGRVDGLVAGRELVLLRWKPKSV